MDETKKRKNSIVPIPPSEQSLYTINAEPWLQVVPDPNCLLEAPAFDHEGNLFVTSVIPGRVFKITPDKKVNIIFSDKNCMLGGCAIHRDGRLFLVGPSGHIIIMNPDGSGMTEVKVRYNGKPLMPDDIVFDYKGNFYVTDFAGAVGNPIGGVYWFSADLTTVRPIVEHLVTANGISLAPKAASMPFVMPFGYELWVAETILNRLLHVRLEEDGITPTVGGGASVAYNFTGDIGPDSNAVDSEGNVYQTLVGQGRIVILNKAGIPVAQVLLPGRDEGKNLFTASLAFKPETNEAFVTLGSTDGGWIYEFRGLAEGLKLFSHE